MAFITATTGVSFDASRIRTFISRGGSEDVVITLDDNSSHNVEAEDWEVFKGMAQACCACGTQHLHPPAGQ